MDHRYLNKPRAALDGALVVLGKPARAIPPPKGPFDNPTFGLNLKATLRTADDLHTPGPQDVGPCRRAPVSAIHPDPPGKLHAPTKLAQGLLAAFRVRHRCRRDDQRPHQAERIHDYVAFAASYLFSPRRSRVARPAPLSSRSDCRGSRPSAWVSCRPLGGRVAARPRGCSPRCRLSAKGESNGTQSDRAANRAARHAKCRRYASDKGWRS